MATQTVRKLVPADSLANRLILIRRELGLSQREAAQRAGVGFGSWQSWETGSAPRHALRDLRWVAERLDVDREWLMFGGPLRPEGDLPASEREHVDSHHEHRSNGKREIANWSKKIDPDWNTQLHRAIPTDPRPRSLEAA